MRRARFFRVSFLVLALAQPFGCAKSADVAQADLAQIDEATVRGWKDPSSPPAIIGLSSDDLERALGAPKSTAEFTLTKGVQLLEYQSSSLYEVIPASGSVPIREWKWTKGNKTIVVWLKMVGEQWVSFDSLAWSDLVRF